MKSKFAANKPIVSVSQEKLREKKISLDEFQKYIPRYIFDPTPLYYGQIKNFWIMLVQWFLRMLVKIFLQPRKSSGDLNFLEVNELYTKEATNYNRKHHLTTRGMDLIWRREMGWFVASRGCNKINPIRILDLCTGTGLVIKEIVSILRERKIDSEIIGLDYNEKMLAIAKNDIGEVAQVNFVQGDAMNLAKNFSPNSIDVVTQMLGIGGISEPLQVFDGVLKILKPSGQFFMIDMHKPIPEQSGEWPFLFKWFRFPILEMITYEQTTIPLVLNRLWGWRNPTLCFYLLPLVTSQNNDGRYWGFNVQIFEQETQRWWFALPLMPIAKIVVEKIEINKETAETRQAILKACSFSQ